MTYPTELYLLDPDWCQCEHVWLPRQQAEECAQHLSEELGWNCSIQDCTRFELLEVFADSALYSDPTGYWDDAQIREDQYRPGEYVRA